jgi:orotidine-5'-phosphate decarboxylase
MGFGERLTEATRKAGTPLCVGLDPRWESLPIELRSKRGGETPESLEALADAYEEFSLAVLNLVHGLTGVVKPQMAFYEAAGTAGLVALARVMQQARAMGYITILDGKRGDIASTAEAYAQAGLGGARHGKGLFPVWGADSLTVNPYLGADSVEPFIEEARRIEGGLFILVRTSNPGSGLFQNLDCQGEPLWQRVARQVKAWGQVSSGEAKLADVGAVVGATQPAELAWMRQNLPAVPLLVPGYGAQGGALDAIKPAFGPNGSGAVVNSSRAILFPYQPDATDWRQKIHHAAQKSAKELANISGMAGT